MSMEYIRSTYKVPAKRGGRVVYTGNGKQELGTIRSAKGCRLNIQLDGMKHAMPFHPTWELEYLPWTAKEACRASTASTNGRKMNKCTECGSYAINHHRHGRDGSDSELCDVCYWRVRATDYATLEAECTRLKNSLLAITARHFAESWKKRTSDAELEQYLSAGIAQLEAERDALRQQRDKLAGLLERIANHHIDGNIRPTVRDCVNGRPDVQDIYGYCDEISVEIEASLAELTT